MGQVALGLRSLLVKLAIFFGLAAALVWVLGGTLFPRPVRVLYPAVEFAGATWQVRLSVGGEHPGEAWYELLMSEPGQRAEPVGGEYAQFGEPLVAGGALFVPMKRRDADGGGWVLRRIAADRSEQSEALPDRLTVEQRLAALRDTPPE